MFATGEHPGDRPHGNSKDATTTYIGTRGEVFQAIREAVRDTDPQAAYRHLNTRWTNNNSESANHMLKVIHKRHIVTVNKIWKLRINRTTFNRLKTKSTFKLGRDAEPRQRSGATLPTTSKESNSARQTLTATRSPNASSGDTNAYQQ